ncbi:MAG: hypothetical protein NXI24_14075 [bacterium]|nr:hypothetical protein [bacterium]
MLGGGGDLFRFSACFENQSQITLSAMCASLTPREYSVQRKAREPLLDFMCKALEAAGCTVIFSSPANRAPFRITFETPLGERKGIIAYAFLANQTPTKNRPTDEHRFQIKYGTKDGKLHELWQDPYGLYTTLLIGINPESGFFVAADPVLHSPTKFFISLEFKDEHVRQILERGWHAWERRSVMSDEPVEVLVGGTSSMFLSLIQFESEALGEAPGHRQLIAEQFGSGAIWSMARKSKGNLILPGEGRVHALAREFELSEKEVLDLIGEAPRLKMAVRGWVAEEHLARSLRRIPGVTNCNRMNIEGGTDVELDFRGRRLTVECKNILRTTLADGTAKLDFQRTRASQADPCSRYYSPEDFDVVAACMHALEEQWIFRFAETSKLDAHKKCLGKLANNVRIDDRWSDDPVRVLAAV